MSPRQEWGVGATITPTMGVPGGATASRAGVNREVLSPKVGGSGESTLPDMG